MKKWCLFYCNILLLSFVLIFIPFNIDVAAQTSEENETYNLYCTNEKIELNDSVSMNKDVCLYGKENNDQLLIQFHNDYREIPLDKLTKKSTEKSSLNLQQESHLLIINSGTSIYLDKECRTLSGIFLKETEYPVYEDNEGGLIIYIGDVPFYLANDEDVTFPKAQENEEVTNEKETTDSSSDETSIVETEQGSSKGTTEELSEEPVVQEKTDPEETAIDEDAGMESSEKESVSETEPDTSTDKSSEELNQEETSSTVASTSTKEEEKEKQLETQSFTKMMVQSVDSWENSDADYFKVTTSTTVYDNRGDGALRPMGQLLEGQVYPRVSDYGNWHRINFGGIYGYVRKSDTVPDDGSSLRNENSKYTNQSRTFETLKEVSVYDNSSGSLTPFGQISKGEHYALAGDYGNWWRILFSDRVGYVRKAEVKAETKPTDNYFRVYTANIPVYDNRSGSLKKVGELKKGESYPIEKDYGNWWRVQFGDFYGYVRKSDTGYATKTEIPNLNDEYTNIAHKLETEQQVEVYDNTSGSLIPFGKIDKGQLFPIATDYGNWWRILYLDRIGYVRKNNVSLRYASYDDYFKAEEDLPIYDNRGSGSLKKVGEVEKGKVYSRVSDYGNWHRIQFGDYYGYVEKFATSPDSGTSVKNKNESYSNQDRRFETLNDVTIYDNSTGSLQAVGKIEKGEMYPIATDYGNWWRVLYSDQVGYVRKNSVKAESKSGDNYFQVYQDNLPVYDNSKGYLTKIGQLEKGQAYPISGDYGNWFKVKFGDKYAYIRKRDVGYSTGKEIRNLNKNYTNSDKSFLVLKNTRVYDNTSGELIPIGELERGTVYPIATDYGNWWRIIYLDRVGYVNKSQLKDYENRTYDEIVQEYRNKDTSSSVSRIKSFFVSPSSNYLIVADNILSDLYKISSYGTFDFSTGIPWGETPVKGKEMSRSYYRALHGQFYLNDLIEAYKKTGNEEYIQKGYEIIKDWIDNNPYGNPAHDLSWHDEGTAKRLITWLNYFDSAKSTLNKEQLKFLFSHMIEHADILLTDDFHTTNTNHGMFQDEALIAFGDYFDSFSKSSLYSLIGKKRLQDYFDFIVSREGVHLEHSPGYHQIVANSVKGYKDFFHANGDDTQYHYYKNLYDKMADYYAWIIKPDGTLPLIGDTFSEVEPSTTLWQDNEYYQYSLTQGKDGIMPNNTSVVFEDAGYAIFRDEWNKGIDATYIHFTAAYHTDYHKHSDDLSVWIYAKGHDLITEAGPNGYDYDLPFTEFGYSSYAHNTLIVNDSGLPRTDGKYDSTYLSDYYIDDKLSSVTGVNKRYEDVQHTRNLKYEKNSQKITVNDTITSNKENNYKLIWNLAEGVVPQIQGNTVKLMINGEEIASMEVNSASNLTIKAIKGQTEPNITGWHLDRGEDPVPTHTIIIETQEINTEIETAFYL
ncbi:hypothetical protein ERJ70_16710 [Sediminibacillus dalangtanensis]|uniref:Heparinase II/III-like protein n=1 Tax=Sediminibacillus dalangtanensis TaxID=2729421 RepID=A0ABX7VYK0_9BACI|nr:heparinase II/III family protein [Sediminibacillus dalangtanensis]QTN00776.1 hypothetical protein ERJ70_16710 [Sediminibacillus dalangtanensis]